MISNCWPLTTVGQREERDTLHVSVYYLISDYTSNEHTIFSSSSECAPDLAGSTNLFTLVRSFIKRQGAVRKGEYNPILLGLLPLARGVIDNYVVRLMR